MNFKMGGSHGETSENYEIVIPTTLVPARVRHVVTIPAKFFILKRLVLRRMTARSVLMHDVAVDGKSVFRNKLHGGQGGPIPGAVFDEVALGVDAFEPRVAYECVLLTVSNETDSELTFEGLLVGFRKVPPS